MMKKRWKRSDGCTIEIGFVLEDVLTDLKRTADHCSNVAIEMITIHENECNTHTYFKQLSAGEQNRFNEKCEQLAAEYPIPETKGQESA